MSAIHHRRSACRLCNSANVELVLSLEPSALAEGYARPEDAHRFQERFPQDLFLCHDCGGVQQLDLIDPTVLFADYSYTSASSPGLSEHFQKYAESVVERFRLPPNAVVCDIGSNDGLLLSYFQKLGMDVIGVDPSKSLAELATARGIPTIADFMSVDLACFINACFYDKQHPYPHFTEDRRTSSQHLPGQAKIVTCNNALAHAEEPGVIIDGIRQLLADDGVFVFEVSYLPDLIKNMVWDWIYHEHSIYYTAVAIASLMHRHGLELFDVQRVPTKGGSIRCFAHKLGVSFPAKRLETMAQLTPLYKSEEWTRDPHTYCKFLKRINAARDVLQMHLQEYHDRGLRIAGYGASATTTTLLHHFGCAKYLDFLVDDNPRLHGLVSPGYQLPVLSPEALTLRKPDVVLITAWRFADAIIARHPEFVQDGGVWIVPLPEYREIARVSV